MTRRLHIGIVGCGVAGSAAGILLARQGHRVSLFEQAPTIGPVGAGLLLQPSGQCVLADMGLLERVVQRAEPIEKLVAISHRGRKISRLVYSDHYGGCVAYGVHRADFFGALHERLLESDVELRLGEIVERVDFVQDRALLINSAGIAHGPFDLVVAADGQNSRLRRALDVPRLEFEYACAALWGIGRCENIERQLYQVTRGTRQLVGLLPTGGGRCSFFWGVDKSELARLQARGFDALLDEVTELCPQARATLASIGSMERLCTATYRCVVLRSAHRDRVVFIGDAAHASSPHLGQGVNLGLLDAQSLAESLAREQTLEEALRRHDARRRWPNMWYSAVSAALAPSFQSSLPLMGCARDLCLPMLQGVPPLRRLMLRTLTGVDRVP